MAKCFCKVRNHAQCFTLNTSGKYHCCFRIKDLNAVSNPKFFPNPKCLETETRLETSSSGKQVEKSVNKVRLKIEEAAEGMCESDRRGDEEYPATFGDMIICKYLGFLYLIPYSSSYHDKTIIAL